MGTVAMAEEFDPEFGQLMHAERVKAPLLFLFGFSTLLFLGLAAGLVLIVVLAAREEPLSGGGWLGVALGLGVLLAVSALFAYFTWQEYRTRFGVRWRVFDGGVEWRRGALVRRLPFRDVRQIGVTHRIVVGATSGLPMSGALVFRLADTVDEPNPIELPVRFDALPNSSVTAKLMAVRDELVGQILATMREELQRHGRVHWTGSLDLTREGIVHRDPRGERLIPWEQMRRLVRDAEEFRVAEHGIKRSRVWVPTTGPNFYPGLELVVERTGLQVERSAPR
jgi:hypothetical protein